jgi:peptidoglycan/LPS O-acetylase OafA/YrhL
MVQMVVLVALAEFWPHMSGWPYVLAFWAGSLALAAPISRFVEYPARRVLRAFSLGTAVEAQSAA